MYFMYTKLQQRSNLVYSHILSCQPDLLMCAGEPQICPPGSFQNMTGKDYCMDCPVGYYCTDGEVPLRCPRGRYCPGNTTADQPYCPRGTFNPNLGGFM